MSNKLKAHQMEINMEIIKAVHSASLKYKMYLVEIDQEILGLEEKKKVLSEVCKTYNEELVTFTKAAGEQTDMSQMKPTCKIK